MRGEVAERMQLLREQQEQRARLLRLRRETLRKIAYLKRKSTIESHDVYHLTKEFFQEFLGKQYQFTMLELKEELKKVYLPRMERERLSNILSDLQLVEHADTHFPRESLVRMLTEFEEIVHNTIKVASGRGGLWEWLRHLIGRDEPEQFVLADLPAVEGGDPANVAIRTLAEKCYGALDRGKLSQAQRAYKDLLRSYNALAAEQRERHYPLIEQTYQDLVNASRK